MHLLIQLRAIRGMDGTRDTVKSVFLNMAIEKTVLKRKNSVKHARLLAWEGKSSAERISNDGGRNKLSF